MNDCSVFLARVSRREGTGRSSGINVHPNRGNYRGHPYPPNSQAIQQNVNRPTENTLLNVMR